MEGEAWLLIIGPPLVLCGLGLALAANRRLETPFRRGGLLLALVGVGQIALTWVSFTACTPFDSDPCHGSSWTSWPEALIGWGVCIAILLAVILFGLVRRLRMPGSD